MAGAIYILCTLTSLLCTVLLLRSYAARRVRLLLWGGLAFAGLTAHNILLFVDLIVFPEVDLSIPRELTTLVGMSLLLYGLVWDTRE